MKVVSSASKFIETCISDQYMILHSLGKVHLGARDDDRDHV